MLIGKDCPGCETVNGDWGCFINNGQINFFAQNTTQFNWSNVLTSNLVSDGSWHFLAATRNGNNGNLNLYIDGVLVGGASLNSDEFLKIINNSM